MKLFAATEVEISTKQYKESALVDKGFKPPLCPGISFKSFISMSKKGGSLINLYFSMIFFQENGDYHMKQINSINRTIFHSRSSIEYALKKSAGNMWEL